MSHDAQGWISVREAAKRLRTSHLTVRRLVDDGNLTSYRTPGTGWVKVLASEVDRLVTESTRPANHAAAG